MGADPASVAREGNATAKAVHGKPGLNPAQKYKDQNDN
jgi:hypothetical protein